MPGVVFVCYVCNVFAIRDVYAAVYVFFVRVVCVELLTCLSCGFCFCLCCCLSCVSVCYSYVLHVIASMTVACCVWLRCAWCAFSFVSGWCVLFLRCVLLRVVSVLSRICVFVVLCGCLMCFCCVRRLVACAGWWLWSLG